MMCFGNSQFDTSFVKENMMGPNAIRMIEELAKSLKLEKGMRVLDLGCGKGLTAIFLAKEFGVTVFATDLWISALENYERFKAMGVEDKIIPIHAEAHDLPYAQGFFDAAISIDAYHYFGIEPDYLEKHFAPLVKKGGQIAVAVPGLKAEFTDGVPQGLQPYLVRRYEEHPSLARMVAGFMESICVGQHQRMQRDEMLQRSMAGLVDVRP